MRELLHKTAKVTIIILSHIWLVTALIVGYWFIERVIQFLAGGDMLVFGTYPLSWLFQAIDVVFAIVIGGLGVTDAIRELRK